MDSGKTEGGGRRRTESIVDERDTKEK